MPGVLANRDTNEHLSAEELIRVGVREIAVQPIKSGPSFIIQERASRILEHLNDVASHDRISSPLSEIFSYCCGDKATQMTINAIARDKDMHQQYVWTDVAEVLNLPKDLIKEVNDGCTSCTCQSYSIPTLQMLKLWQEIMPQCALVCVVYDALYTVGLENAAN
jgi:hypothetical protein